MLRRLRYSFCIITKDKLQQLKSTYVPNPSLSILEPFMKPCNISSLYQILNESKSFNNAEVEETLRQINKLDATGTSDEDKHASARIKLDLSEKSIKRGDHREAMSYLDEGLRSLRTMEIREDIEEAMFLRRLGEIELTNKDTRELALEHLLLSIKLFEQYLEDEEIHMATAVGHLAPLYSLIGWYYMLQGNALKAKEYTDHSIKYFLRVSYNHNDFEHMMCTRCQALISLGQIEEMKVEAKSMLRRTHDISNRIWFLNLLVENGATEYKTDLDKLLSKVREKLGAEKFEQYRQSMGIKSE